MAKIINILHVEDDVEYHELFKTQMNRINRRDGAYEFIFTSVTSLAKAMTLFEEGGYDVVVTDHQIAGGTGLDFLKEVRDRDLFVPVIFLTAQGDEEVARNAFVHGANDYFSKQVSLLSYEKIYNAIIFQNDLHFSILAEKEARKKLFFNETLLINLFESMSDVLYFKGTDGRYIIVNKSFESVTGVRRCDIIGKTDEELFRDLDAKGFIENDGLVKDKMEAMYFEEKFVSKGETSYFETLKMPIFDDERNMKGVMGISRDISVRKKIEASLRQSEMLYKTLVGNIPNACLVLFNKDMEVVFTGGEGSKYIFGVKNEDHTCANLLDNFDKNASKQIKNGFDLAMDGQKTHFELARGLMTYDAFIIPVDPGPNEHSMAMALFYDITDRKKNENELKAQRMELSDFAHTVSHNLKNQLISLSAYTQLILDGDDDSEQYCSNIIKISQNINDYIVGQLKLAEAGRNIGNMKKIDLGEIVDRAGKVFAVAIEKGPLPTLMVDPLNMVDVFMNLISNAIVHGDANRIYVSSKREGDCYKIYFKDNGKGIPREHLDKVFDTGFSTGGNGFGLAIVKKVIEAHYGTILAKSAEGDGTTFEIVLPAGDN